MLIAALGVFIAASGRSRGSLATFGAFSAVIIYGGIMNPAAAEPMLEKPDRIKVKYGLVE